MRWGIREEAQDDHMTSVLCMKEIQKCQRISVGPAFVVSDSSGLKLFLIFKLKGSV